MSTPGRPRRHRPGDQSRPGRQGAGAAAVTPMDLNGLPKPVAQRDPQDKALVLLFSNGKS